MREPRRSKPGFPDVYGLTGKELLDWSWAAERLEACRNYWICTTRADGGPHAMPVWAIWWDDGVLWSSAPNSVKARNLDRDPRVVVHLESGDEAVILEGEVARKPIDDAAADAYGEKYGYRPDPSMTARPWMHLVPQRAFAWREADYPHTATRFDWD